MKKNFLIAISVLVIVTLCGCAAKTVEETTALVTTVAETTTKETTEATTEETTTEAVSQETIQFYLFGVDTVGYTEVDQGRSDLIKVVQISPEQKSIKFASILRDTRSPIADYGEQKINGAYQLGGADLAMTTINEQFGLDIHKYIMINFAGLVQIIDDFGGVDIEITEEEAEIINEQLDGDYVGDGRNHYSQQVAAGMAHLDGSETLAFCRIRKIDSDYFRSARQNKVLKNIYEKLSTMTNTERLNIITQLFKYIETNMTADEFIRWTKLGLEDYEFSAIIWPDQSETESVWRGIDHTGSWVWIYDLAHAGEEIKAYFGDYWVDPAEPIEVDEEYEYDYDYDDYYIYDYNYDYDYNDSGDTQGLPETQTEVQTESQSIEESEEQAEETPAETSENIGEEESQSE